MSNNDQDEAGTEESREQAEGGGTVGGAADAVRVDLGESDGERSSLGDSFRAFPNELLSAKFDAHVHQLPNGQSTTAPLPAFIGAQVPEELLANPARAR